MGRRVVFAAGGTGGHFYPGLVLAQTLKARGWEPLMFVRAEDPALDVLEREGIASVEVALRGLPRTLGLPLLSFARDLERSLGLAFRAISDFKPSLVVGMGGYLTFPVVAAAARYGVPRALHESNAVLGLANRASAMLGATLFWGLPPTAGHGLVTGTPIRQALWAQGDAAAARQALGLAEGKTTVLVFGGSQGARSLNRTAPAALAQAARQSPGGLQVLHLAGSTETAEVQARYSGSPLAAVVLPFLDSMELAYAAADLALCRSGASTLAELAAQRLAAVLVPLPSAAAGHQEINARALASSGACRLLLERDLEGRLAPLLCELLLSPSSEATRRAMATAYGSLQLPPPERCAQDLADAIEQLSEKAPDSRL